MPAPGKLGVLPLPLPHLPAVTLLVARLLEHCCGLKYLIFSIKPNGTYSWKEQEIIIVIII